MTIVRKTPCKLNKVCVSKPIEYRMNICNQLKCICPHVAYAAACSKAMVLSLLIVCLWLLSYFVGILCLVLTLLYNILFPSSFAIIKRGGESWLLYFGYLLDVL